MKVALVYDRVNKWGGAERVLLALHEMFPDAPLYTSVYDEKNASWAKVFPKIYTSFLQRVPCAKSNHESFGWLMPFIFESFNFDKYDLVISVTSEAAKGIITKPKTKHICYMLTPTRYLWSHYDLYFKKWLLRFISKPIVKHLRNWEKLAAQRPDQIIAISSEVKDRIKKYYDRDSEVIFPPVKNLNTNNEFPENRKNYLVISRLVPYKKVDLAIKAFNKLKLPLIVIGSGSQEAGLKLIAGRNIKFAGQISERELIKYYKNAKALVMPQEEDFGIISSEAQFFGVPVIAFKKGGALDTVIEGKTGIFFLKQEVDSIVSAVAQFNQRPVFDRPSLVENANRFSEKVFTQRFGQLIKKERL
jgi:glycosyltransferase involved in cell wall biosynthesis